MNRTKKVVEPIERFVKAVDHALAVNAICNMMKTTEDIFKCESNDKVVKNAKKGALGLSFEEACKQAKLQAASQVRAPEVPMKPIDMNFTR